MKTQIFLPTLLVSVVFFCACQQESAVSEKKAIAIEVDDHPIEKAWKVRKKLLNGVSFQEMAKMYSDDPGSAQYGGDLGVAHFGQFVPEYEAAIRALEPGEISEPVLTKYGYHIIQLVAIDGDRFTSRHILISP